MQPRPCLEGSGDWAGSLAMFRKGHELGSNGPAGAIPRRNGSRMPSVWRRWLTGSRPC